jgi:hypothetical protein
MIFVPHFFFPHNFVEGRKKPNNGFFATTTEDQTRKNQNKEKILSQ